MTVLRISFLAEPKALRAGFISRRKTVSFELQMQPCFDEDRESEDIGALCFLMQMATRIWICMWSAEAMSSHKDSPELQDRLYINSGWQVYKIGRAYPGDAYFRIMRQGRRY